MFFAFRRRRHADPPPLPSHFLSLNFPKISLLLPSLLLTFPGLDRRLDKPLPLLQVHSLLVPRGPQEDPRDPLDDHADRVLAQQVEHHRLVGRVAAQPREHVLVEGHPEQHRRDEGLHGPGDARGGVAAQWEGQEAAHREARVWEVAEDVLLPRFRVGHARHDAAVAEAAAPAVPDARVDDARPAGPRGEGRGEGEQGQDGRGGGGPEEERGEEGPGEDKGEDLGEAVFFFFFFSRATEREKSRRKRG